MKNFTDQIYWYVFHSHLTFFYQHFLFWHIHSDPSITDGVHRNENFVEIIPVFSTFSKFFKVFQKNY